MANECAGLRILDVNMNRATEGLRVVEELCRFVLEDGRLALVCKKLRGEISGIIRVSEYQKEKSRKAEKQKAEDLLRTRSASSDVGRNLYTKNEGKRTGFVDIFFANMKRAQEAVRCLEEFSKLLDASAGKRFKAIRFTLYELEKRIAPRLAKAVKLDFDLYVVTDPSLGHIHSVRRALSAGVKIIQLRDKKAEKKEYLKMAKKVVFLTKKKGVVFIVNDYWEMVDGLGADGVHLGQEDLQVLKFSLKKVREEMGADKIIGISTHSFTQALEAEKLGADYISVGPVFKTPSKPWIKPVGLKLLRQVVKKIKIPVVAIGGINKEKVKQVLRSGCSSFAVIRGLDEADKMLKEIRRPERVLRHV